MPIKTILVAVALHGDSERVASRAVQLANQHKARLVCVHVLEDMEPWSSDLPPPIDAHSLINGIKNRIRAELQCLLVAAKKPPTIHVETGRPYSIVESLAHSTGADLIVLGPGAPKNFREKVFGSTADRVVRCASCPVLVVREIANAPYHHIVVGVDLSPHAQAAALGASRLSPDALRELIHVFDIPVVVEQAMHEAGTRQIDIDQYRNARAKTVRKQILNIYGNNGRLPKSINVRIVRGDAATTLIRASRRKQVDLVALGSQGTNAVAQHLLGSVAREILIGAKCDVLIVPVSGS